MGGGGGCIFVRSVRRPRRSRHPTNPTGQEARRGQQQPANRSRWEMSQQRCSGLAPCPALDLWDGLERDGAPIKSHALVTIGLGGGRFETPPWSAEIASDQDWEFVLV
jgi:hypothetical protein